MNWNHNNIEIYKILNQGKSKIDDEEEILNMKSKEENQKQEQYIKKMVTSHKEDQSIKIKKKGCKTKEKKEKKCCKSN